MSMHMVFNSCYLIKHVMKWKMYILYYSIICTSYVCCSFYLKIFNPFLILYPTFFGCTEFEVFEICSQFTFLGVNVLNEEKGHYTHLLENYCFIWIYLQSAYDFASNKPLTVKNRLCVSELESMTYFGLKSPNKEIGSTPIFEEVGCHTHFLDNCCFNWVNLQSSWFCSNKPMILEMGSDCWELQPIFHFGSKYLYEEISAVPIFEKYSFYLNIFIIYSWFCIQQALGCETHVSCLRITVNIPFWA